MRITILMVSISITLIAGCTSASDTASDAVSATAEYIMPAAISAPNKLIALKGVHFDMKAKEFRLLFKIKKEMKKGKDFNVALDTDTLIKVELDSYMDQPAQGASATFYDGYLADLSIKIREASLPFFLQAFKGKYGKPKETRLPKTDKLAQYVWKLNGGETVTINLVQKGGPWLEYSSSSHEKKHSLRLKKLLQEQFQAILNKPAYTAVLTCTSMDMLTVLIACLNQSYLKVRSGGRTKIYTFADLGRDGPEKKLSLKKQFKIEVQNSASSRALILNIVIRDRMENIVYTDSVMQGGWINVGNK